MKTLLCTVGVVMLATHTMADADPRYQDPANIMTDLDQLVGWCNKMDEGEIRREIFDIQFAKHGNRCQFLNGELDDQIRTYLNDNKLEWAGVEGMHGLWVTTSDAVD